MAAECNLRSSGNDIGGNYRHNEVQQFVMDSTNEDGNVEDRETSTNRNGSRESAQWLGMKFPLLIAFPSREVDPLVVELRDGLLMDYTVTL
jgi:hypothetical protein